MADTQSPYAQTLVDVLTEKVMESYSNTIVKYPVLLLTDSQPLPCQYEDKKTYRYWFLRTDAMKSFHEASNYIFANLKTLIRKYREEQTDEADSE
jgi:hypothetical protein